MEHHSSRIFLEDGSAYEDQADVSILGIKRRELLLIGIEFLSYSGTSLIQWLDERVRALALLPDISL